ncbi:MAG: PIN domain-containing protein [Gemmatimonadaceae bacterium]
MIAYTDSSILLRVVLNQPGRVKAGEWNSIDLAIASALVEVECLRTLDRMSLEGSLEHSRLAPLRETIYRLLESVEVVELTATLLRRASSPLPTPLGTLDAIHLTTALLWAESRGQSPVMLTHDRALAMAARAFGLRVLGVE